MTTPAGSQAADGPSIARVYDYLLGGSHNFDADKVAAAEFLARWPDARQTMAANRAFLGRAVRYLAREAGIRQFLDVGSGIPTMGNVHAIAQQTAPGARVVYVNIDEVAVLHSRAILAGNDQAIAIQADLRAPHPSWIFPACAACSICPSRPRCCWSRSSTSCPTPQTMTPALWSPSCVMCSRPAAMW